LEFDKALKALEELDDDVLRRISFSVPWQYNDDEGEVDADGFAVVRKGDSDYSEVDVREKLQAECWRKFNKNPQFSTSIRRTTGRITGFGFETSSEVFKIQRVIEEIELDPRNRLYNFWPKYVARSFVEGELFLCLTVHPNGFIEVDFIDPSTIRDKGTEGSGIIFHPKKPTMPLFYFVTKSDSDVELIPSIFIARYPEMVKVAMQDEDFDLEMTRASKSNDNKFKKFKGYYRFVVSWDKGFLTRRSVSYLRTTIEWLNHYENLKKYEIDHKKSSGAYLWVVTITDPKAFRIWLSMDDADKRKTGIMQKKTPGGTLVLPPGMELSVKNPNLSPIRDQDTDILEMVTAGLNEPADVTTGTAKGTFASIKASRGPMSDNISDEIAYFDRWLKYDFWGSVFFLRSSVTNFPKFFKRKEVIEFLPTVDGKEPKKKIRNVSYPPEQLIDVSYPVSEMIDFDTRAKGLLGSKHGPVTETVGVPASEISKRMGFGGYGRNRLRKATEDILYPKLVYNLDAESIQEKIEGEPKKKKSSNNAAANAK